MTPEQIEQERAAFEAWTRDAFPGLDLVKLAHNGEIVGFTEPTTIKMFAAWLERAEQTGWISVEEDLPDYGITVLTATEEGFVTTNHLVEARGSAWDCIWRFDFTSSPITHWQPLTQPPAGGAK